MNSSRSAFSPQVENLIKGVARAIVTWVTVAITVSSLSKWVSEAKSSMQEGAGRVRDEAAKAFGLKQEPLSMRERMRARIYESAPVRKLREMDVIGDGDMEKKNGWSFFKVILVLGILIAVAVFILDRVLPKPYRDEELDEAWEDDFPGDGHGSEVASEQEEAMENPNGAGSKSKKRAAKPEGGDEADPSEE